MVGRLGRLAEALALAPADADGVVLLNTVAQELVPAFGALLVLLTRDDDGHLTFAGSSPASEEQDAVIRAAVPWPTDDMEVGPALMEAVRRELLAAVGLPHAAAARVADGRKGDGVLFLGLGADHVSGDAAAPDAEQHGQPHDAPLAVVGALLGGALAVREGRRREAALQEQIEANARDGRTLAHQLNNDLTMPVGVVELLLDRTAFAPDLRDMLQAAAHDLAALEEHIRGFHSSMRAQSGADDSEGLD